MEADVEAEVADLEEEEVHGHPNGPAPVRIAAEEARRALAGRVLHAVVRSLRKTNIGTARSTNKDRGQVEVSTWTRIPRGVKRGIN